MSGSLAPMSDWYDTITAENTQKSIDGLPVNP